MNRRTFLAAGTTSLAALAGCTGLLGSSSSATVNHPGNLETSFNANMELPTDETLATAYRPSTRGTDERSVDESQFSALSTNGETVTLVPVEVARYWHRRREARFVDARGLAQYKRAHIFGAVNSPAVRGSQGGAIGGWPTDDRVVVVAAVPTTSPRSVPRASRSPVSRPCTPSTRGSGRGTTTTTRCGDRTSRTRRRPSWRARSPRATPARTSGRSTRRPASGKRPRR